MSLSERACALAPKTYRTPRDPNYAHTAARMRRGGERLACAPLNVDRLITANEVLMLCGFSHSELYRRQKRPGGFPARVKLGPRATRWRLFDVLEWQRAQFPHPSTVRAA